MIAAAPIAALAPLPKVLEKRRNLPIGHPSCSCKFCVLMRQYRTGKMSEMSGFDWYLAPAVTGGPVGEAIYGPASPARRSLP